MLVRAWVQQIVYNVTLQEQDALHIAQLRGPPWPSNICAAEQRLYG